MICGRSAGCARQNFWHNDRHGNQSNHSHNEPAPGKDEQQCPGPAPGLDGANSQPHQRHRQNSIQEDGEEDGRKEVGGAFALLAAATCPTSIKRTSSAVRQPSNIVRMPKTIRPVERSLYEGNAVASTGAVSGFCWFIGWAFVCWIRLPTVFVQRFD